MHITVRGSVSALALGLAACTFAGAAIAQTTGRDGIGDLLKRPADATQLAQSQAAGQKAAPGASTTTGPTQATPEKPEPEKDLREG